MRQPRPDYGRGVQVIVFEKRFPLRWCGRTVFGERDGDDLVDDGIERHLLHDLTLPSERSLLNKKTFYYTAQADYLLHTRVMVLTLEDSSPF